MVIEPAQIAHRSHLGILFILEARDDRVKLAAAIADTDVTKRDPIVRPSNARIGQRRAVQRGASSRHERALLQKSSPVELIL
jgi:hypothetical protein